ncbi:MAG: hypothetical protein AB1705_15615 [Verrucomicrobiota bacterium]
MTLALAWVAKRSDGREDLYFASDSRTRGGMVLDVTPKILTLPRSDCAICFAGDTAATFPLMLHISAAIAAHAPAHERNLDIGELKGHLLKVCTDIMATVTDRPVPLHPTDVQFILAGYSWRAKDFCIWTIYYEPPSKRFRARPAEKFHSRLRKAAFIGDWATRFRASLVNELNQRPQAPPANHEPLRLMAQALKSAGKDESIGGAPQVVRIGPHMNARPFCVKWGPEQKLFLFGRLLFEYENCDYWTIDPETGKIEAPRHFRLDKRHHLDD